MIQFMRRHLMILVIAAMFGAAMYTTTGCGTNVVVKGAGLVGHHVPPAAVLKGVVTDEATGEPMPGVTIEIQGRTTRSLRDGTYLFSELRISESRVTASFEGFMTIEASVKLAEGVNSYDIRMRRVR